MEILHLSILFVGLGIGSAVLNFILLKWTKTLGAKNEINSNEIRWSDSYKPALGGISFYVVFLFSILLYYFYHDVGADWTNESVVIGIVSAVTIGFFAGLVDDAYNTVPWFKFIAQFACGALFVGFDVRIAFFDVFWMDALLTIFWTISVMNSINMLDNMDGVTTLVSIAILTCAGICALPLSDSSLFFTLTCGGMVFGLLGFLVFNWNPSKIFMGDTGSQLLGALLAGVGVVFFWNNPNVAMEHTWLSKLAIVLTAFVVPIGDSLTVTINRLRRGQSPFVGGKDHTTHHLSYAGLSDRQVAYVMILLSFASISLIAGLHVVSEEYGSLYLVTLISFSLVGIGFLYSTTQWKKSKTIYQNKMQSIT